MLVVTGFGYLAIGNDGSGETVIAQGASAIPTSFGSWSTIADAPIDPWPYGVTAWTGSEFVVWAGSSLSRGFAYTDGAIYQPETDSWALMDVPGWGHPGLSSAFFDGELYALAKGGGTRFDPIAGQWNDLPEVEGMFLAATVATDRGVWGLGPAGVDDSGQPDLAIAEFDPTTDSWRYGPVFEGTDEQAEIVAGLGLFAVGEQTNDAATRRCHAVTDAIHRKSGSRPNRAGSVAYSRGTKRSSRDIVDRIETCDDQLVTPHEQVPGSRAGRLHHEQPLVLPHDGQA